MRCLPVCRKVGRPDLFVQSPRYAMVVVRRSAALADVAELGGVLNMKFSLHLPGNAQASAVRRAKAVLTARS